MDKKDIHTLELMTEIERDGTRSQRELSRRLNVSVGLINAFLKRLVTKGHFKVKTMPRNRVKYFLTAKGLARKSKLTVDYLRYSVNFYREIKGLLLDKFREMEENRLNSILFLGAGEVAELAYLYLQLTDIQLAGVVDDNLVGKDFFGFTVDGFDRLKQVDWDMVLLARLDDTDEDIKRLMEEGIKAEKIVTI